MKKSVKYIIVTSAVLFLLLMVVSQFLMWFHVTEVEGASMEPTLRSGDSIFLSSFNPIKEGDIVVFSCLVDRCKHINFIKRLKSIDQNGCYYFEGDNKDHSFDSRSFGYLCPSEITTGGKVVFSIKFF